MKIFLTAIFFYAAFFLASALLGSAAFGAVEKTFHTQFSNIHYTQEKELEDFFWRLSGKRLSLSLASAPLQNRVDEILERVQSILNIYPESFVIDIHLKACEAKQTPAYYSAMQKAIFACLERVTDGILAHEAAHALIDRHFETAVPEKTQEILAQYVDQHLWEEAE